MIVARFDTFKNVETLPDYIRKAVSRVSEALAKGVLKPGVPFEFDGCKATLSSPETVAPGKKPFEAHRQFLDVHVVVAGMEGYEVARLADCTVSQPYDADKDFELYDSQARFAHQLFLGPGDALVVFPEDAHKPCLSVPHSAARLDKVVIKIPVA